MSVAAQRKFDPTKPVVTTDGRSARIICTDKGGSPHVGPIIALVKYKGDVEAIQTFLQDGTSADGRSSLVNIPSADRTGLLRHKSHQLRYELTRCTLGRERPDMEPLPRLAIIVAQLASELNELDIFVRSQFEKAGVEATP